MGPEPMSSSGGPKVTVWEADGSPWRGVGYGSEIARRLRELGCSVNTVPLIDRVPTDDELDAPLHVLSGGTTPATTTTGWVGAARGPLAEVLARASTGSATVVGVCFGAQLIAVSLAGPRAVRPARRGMEAGLRTVRSTSSGAQQVVSEFHHHEVRASALRSIGATVTWENDHSEVQGFAHGANVFGFQFHPELDPRRTVSTIHANRSVIRSCGGSVTEAMRSVRDHRHRWQTGCFEQMVVERLAPRRAASRPAEPAVAS